MLEKDKYLFIGGPLDGQKLQVKIPLYSIALPFVEDIPISSIENIEPINDLAHKEVKYLRYKVTIQSIESTIYVEENMPLKGLKIFFKDIKDTWLNLAINRCKDCSKKKGD